MLCSIKISLINKTFNLALVQQQYDYKYRLNNQQNKYNCPCMILTSQYEFIPVKSAIEQVHVISQFTKNNEYLVNIFIF